MRLLISLLNICFLTVFLSACDGSDDVIKSQGTEKKAQVSEQEVDQDTKAYFQNNERKEIDAILKDIGEKKD